MAVTPFIEDRLPVNVERGAVGGPQFNTTVLPLDSGFEQRNSNWAHPRGQWDISYGISREEDLEAVKALFYACRGKLTGFRFKDWSDFKLKDQVVGTGNGAQTAFQVYKRYQAPGGTYYDRPLRKLVQGTVAVRLSGTPTSNFTVNYNTGVITLGSAPANGVLVSVTCQFDVPVRFDTDKLDVTTELEGVQEIQSIPIVELKQV